MSVPERNATMRYTQAEKGLIEKGKSSWKDEIRDAIEQSQATNFEELERVEPIRHHNRSCHKQNNHLQTLERK